MRPDVERRFVAFVQTFANRCAACLRRSPENCRPCPSAWANDLMRERAIDTPPAGVATPTERMRSIVEQLRRAGRPLRARDIDAGDITPQLKHWTLLEMQALDIIRRLRQPSRRSRRPIYTYQLTPKKEGEKQ